MVADPPVGDERQEPAASTLEDVIVSGETLEERAESEGAFFRVRAEPEALERLREQLRIAAIRSA